MVSSNGMNEMEQWMGGKLFHLRRKKEKMTLDGMLWIVMEQQKWEWNDKIEWKRQ